MVDMSSARKGSPGAHSTSQAFEIGRDGQVMAVSSVILVIPLGLAVDLVARPSFSPGRPARVKRFRKTAHIHGTARWSMKTRYMHYERLQTLPGHNHVRIGKEVELEDGDDEEAALDSLRAEINAKLGLEAGNERLRDETARLQEEHDRLGAKIAARRAELKKVRDAITAADDFLTSARDHGLEIPSIKIEDALS